MFENSSKSKHALVAIKNPFEKQNDKKLKNLTGELKILETI